MLLCSSCLKQRLGHLRDKPSYNNCNHIKIVYRRVANFQASCENKGVSDCWIEKMAFSMALLVFIKHMGRPTGIRSRPHIQITPRISNLEDEELSPRKIISPTEELGKLTTWCRFSPPHSSKRRVKLLRLAPKIHWQSRHYTREKDFYLTVLCYYWGFPALIFRLLKQHLNKYSWLWICGLFPFGSYKTLSNSNRAVCSVQEISLPRLYIAENWHHLSHLQYPTWWYPTFCCLFFLPLNTKQIVSENWQIIFQSWHCQFQVQHYVDMVWIIFVTYVAFLSPIL